MRGPAHAGEGDPFFEEPPRGSNNWQADRSDMAAYIIEKAAGRGPLYLVELKGEKPVWSPELRRARRFSSWEAAVDAVVGLREILKDLSEDYLVVERR